MVSILKTENFGHLAMIEVGALCVGKIVQTYQQKRFQQGDEKGFFEFGGSTVILLGEKGRWQPIPEIIRQTHLGRETLIGLGSPVALCSDIQKQSGGK